MIPEKVIEVIETYRQFFVKRNIGKIDYPHNELLDGKAHGLEHCHGMLDKMVEFVREGKMEKAFVGSDLFRGFSGQLGSILSPTSRTTTDHKKKRR